MHNLTTIKSQFKYAEYYQENLNWDSISSDKILSEEFLDLFKNKVNWSYISKYQKLSLKLIKKFSKYLNWYNILKYQHLTISVCFYKHYLNSKNSQYIFSLISEYQKMTESFMDKYKDQLNWNSIIYHKRASIKYCLEHRQFIYERLISKKDVDTFNQMINLK